MQQTTLTVLGKVFPHEPQLGDSNTACFHTHISSLLPPHACRRSAHASCPHLLYGEQEEVSAAHPAPSLKTASTSQWLSCLPTFVSGEEVKISHFTENMGLSNDPVFQFTMCHSMSFFSVRVRPTSPPFLWVFTPAPSPQPIYCLFPVALQEAQT